MTESPAGICERARAAAAGAVVEMLLERQPAGVPGTGDRSAAGAKDDRRDARVLADSLRTDRRSFRHLQVEAPEVIELREWSRMREELQQERSRLTIDARATGRYYPQMLELGTRSRLVLWEKAPTPAEAARIKASIAANKASGASNDGSAADPARRCRSAARYAA